MADLLTHVLAAYVLATICSWCIEGVTPAVRTVAMIGAVVPDLNRMDLVVPPATIESVLGVPFSWSAFHTLGGVAFAVVVGAALVAPRYRRRVAALLALGAGAHLVLDSFLFTSSGYSESFLWPLTDHRFATDGFYKSYDRWPLVVAAVVTGIVRLVDRRRSQSPTAPRAARE